MKVKCDYCDNYYEGEATECPNCGAPNAHIRRTANAVPHTIDELLAWAASKNMPLDRMHVHIGEDFKGAKAFGIYRDGDKVVVYKNKADGSRAVRYEGTDEAYAVNELYTKIKELANEGREASTNAKKTPPVRKTSSHSMTSGRIITLCTIALIVISVLVSVISDAREHSSDGYYSRNNDTYYRYGNNWYYYDNTFNDWSSTDLDVDADDWTDYYDGKDYDSSYGGYDFEDSDYYDSYDSSSSSYDSDSSWDSDDWDSGWDSDWDSGSDYSWDSGSDWDSDW